MRNHEHTTKKHARSKRTWMNKNDPRAEQRMIAQSQRGLHFNCRAWGGNASYLMPNPRATQEMIETHKIASQRPLASRVYYIKGQLPPLPGNVVPRNIVQSHICTRAEADAHAKRANEQYGVNNFRVSTRL